MEKGWFNKSVSEIKTELNTDFEKGLSEQQYLKAVSRYGKNGLKSKKKKSTFQKFIEQFKDFMIIVLIISAIISGIVGIAEGEGITDSIIILIVVIVNAIIGVLQENKAEKSLEALQKLSSHTAKVVRNGMMTVVEAKDLVPGDIVVLDTGDFVPADLRLIEAINLKAQESALTGESVPVEKDTKVIDGNVGIGDRTNMLFSSSLLTYGRGKAIVVETGMNTEVGKIANIINTTIDTETPLQTKLNKLRKNSRNNRFNNMYNNIYSRVFIWKRTNSYVYDSSKFSSSCNPRGITSCLNNCFSNWCSENGKAKCYCKKFTSCRDIRKCNSYMFR